MNRGIITINETGIVTMPKAPVWMTKFEIADLFGVFSCDVAGDAGVSYMSRAKRERKLLALLLACALLAWSVMMFTALK